MAGDAEAESGRHDAHDAQMANCKPWASHPNVVKQYGSEEKALKACMDKLQLQEGEELEEGGWDPRHLKTKTTKVAPVNVDERTSQKISVREAKEITRRIIERIRKEGK